MDSNKIMLKLMELGSEGFTKQMLTFTAEEILRLLLSCNVRGENKERDLFKDIISAIQPSHGLNPGQAEKIIKTTLSAFHDKKFTQVDLDAMFCAIISACDIRSNEMNKHLIICSLGSALNAHVGTKPSLPKIDMAVHALFSEEQFIDYSKISHSLHVLAMSAELPLTLGMILDREASESSGNGLGYVVSYMLASQSLCHSYLEVMGKKYTRENLQNELRCKLKLCTDPNQLKIIIGYMGEGSLYNHSTLSAMKEWMINESMIPGGMKVILKPGFNAGAFPVLTDFALQNLDKFAESWKGLKAKEIISLVEFCYKNAGAGYAMQVIERIIDGLSVRGVIEKQKSQSLGDKLMLFKQGLMGDRLSPLSYKNIISMIAQFDLVRDHKDLVVLSGDTLEDVLSVKSNQDFSQIARLYPQLKVKCIDYALGL
jgi:hypothetical protein